LDRGTLHISGAHPGSAAEQTGVLRSTRPADRRDQDPSRASQHVLYASDPRREERHEQHERHRGRRRSGVGPDHSPHRLRRLVGTGVIATLAAKAATTLAAALAQALGVDFEVSGGGESIPLAGFAVVIGFFSVVGIVIAAALRRWSARPSRRFTQTA
jgi:hypothetical protein